MSPPGAEHRYIDSRHFKTLQSWRQNIPPTPLTASQQHHPPHTRTQRRRSTTQVPQGAQQRGSKSNSEHLLLDRRTYRTLTAEVSRSGVSEYLSDSYRTRTGSQSLGLHSLGFSAFGFGYGFGFLVGFGPLDRLAGQLQVATSVVFSAVAFAFGSWPRLMTQRLTVRQMDTCRSGLGQLGGSSAVKSGDLWPLTSNINLLTIKFCAASLLDWKPATGWDFMAVPWPILNVK